MIPLIRPLATLMMVAGLVSAVGACADQPSPSAGQSDIEAAAVEATIERAGAALAAGDVEGFVDQWTDDGLEQVFYENTQTFAQQTGYYVEARQWALGPAARTVVTGTIATTVAPLFFRLVGAPRRFSLLKMDGTWKIDGAALTTSDTGGATVVDVSYDGSPSTLTVSEVSGGDIALEVRNGTAEVHELNILTVPASRDMASFFAHPELEPPLPEGHSMPDGMDFIGGINRIEPGTTLTVLFQHALPSGRYVLFCNVEDADGVPHARVGEYTEFSIE